jgi:hypothetical protein
VSQRFILGSPSLFGLLSMCAQLDARIDKRRDDVGEQIAEHDGEADTSVTPMMIGMSTRWIACQASWPIPGQPNTPRRRRCRP